MNKIYSVAFLVLVSYCLFAQKITGHLLAICEHEPVIINSINKSWGKSDLYNLVVDSVSVAFQTDVNGYFEITISDELFDKIISTNRISIRGVGLNYSITNFTFSDSLIRLPKIIDCVYTSLIEDDWFSEKATKKQLKKIYSKVKEFGADSLYYYTGNYKVGEDKYETEGNKLYIERKGVWKMFLTEGDILLKRCKYRNGALNGAYIEYDDKGNKIIIGHLKNGQMKGKWKIYNALTMRYYNVTNENWKLIFDLK